MPGVKGRSGGHNRKSLDEHRLMGSFRPARHGHLLRSTVTAPKPVLKPVTLSAEASGVWDALAPLALALGTLTPSDAWAFATLCELQATFQQAAAAKDGRQLFRLEQPDEDEPRMVLAVDAVLKLERDTASAARPYYELFGLTPVARARISVPQAPEEPQSKWAGVLT